MAQTTHDVLLIFDGRCGVCTRFVRLLKGLDRGGRVLALAYQRPGTIEMAGLSLEDCRAAAWAVSSDGERYRGAEAVGVALSSVLGTRIPHTLYKLPVIGRLQDLAYGWIAANRRKLPGDTPYCSQHPDQCRSS